MTSAVIDEAVETADEIERKIQEFFDKVNDVISWVPWPFDDLIEPIEQGMAQLREKMQEFWDRLTDFLTNRGDPDKLKQFADEWRESIGNRIGEIAGDIKLTQMRSNIEWEGRAAEAYKTIVPPQSEGLEGIKSLAVQINTSLKSLANGIEDFWTAILIAFGTFVVAIAAAIIGAVTVVGIPAAIVAVLVAVGACVALIATAITSRDAVEDTIKAEQDTIAQGTHDIGTQWTKSKTSMSDPGDWEAR
ncbi:MAG: hypothetical protein ACRDSE_01725 [Pseudonocardiaceae bacterium]